MIGVTTIKRSRKPLPEASAATSSVQKACRILRALSDARYTRLTQIAANAGLDKATVLRLLDILAREGFVIRDPETKQYALGTEAFVLGAAAATRHDPRPVARPSLLRLANTFEDTVILSIPRGFESVCVDLQPGSFAIRANYLEIGSRRPLGVGTGSLALLAWMPDDEIAAVMPLVATRLKAYPHFTPQMIEKNIMQSRSRGYALLLDLVVARIGGIAMPILGNDQRPVAAISIAALSDRISSRELALAGALKHEAAICESLWRCTLAKGPPSPSTSHANAVPRI